MYIFDWDENNNQINQKNMELILKRQVLYFMMKRRFYLMILNIQNGKKDLYCLE